MAVVATAATKPLLMAFGRLAERRDERAAEWRGAPASSLPLGDRDIPNWSD
jgi:hypothetical protein